MCFSSPQTPQVQATPPPAPPPTPLNTTGAAPRTGAASPTYASNFAAKSGTNALRIDLAPGVGAGNGGGTSGLNIAS